MSKKHFLTNSYKNLKFGDYIIEDFFYPNAKYLNENCVSALGGIAGIKSFYAATFLVSKTDISSKEKLNDVIESFNQIQKSSVTTSYTFILFVMDDDGKTVIPQNNEKHYYDLTDIENIINEVPTIHCEHVSYADDNCFLYDKDKSHEVHKKYSENKFIEKLFEQEFSYRSAIGMVVHLCFNYNPVSEYDFVNQYFEYAENHKELFVMDRGLTRFEVMEMATRFQRRVCEVARETITLEDSFHYIMWHIINFAYSGFNAEKKYGEILYKQGYTTCKADETLDKDYGIDIVVKKNNNVAFYVQVKPVSFLKKGTFSQFTNITEKYNKAVKKFGYETYYAFYDRDLNGKIIWKTNEKNGTTLFDYSIFNRY